MIYFLKKNFFFLFVLGISTIASYNYAKYLTVNETVFMAVVANQILNGLVAKNYYLNNSFLIEFKNSSNKNEILNLILTIFLFITALLVIFYVLETFYFIYFQKIKIFLLIMPFFAANGFFEFFFNHYNKHVINYIILLKYFAIIVVISENLENELDILILYLLLIYSIEFTINILFFLKTFNLNINLIFKKDFRKIFFIKNFFKYLLYNNKIKILLTACLIISTFSQILN